MSHSARGCIQAGHTNTRGSGAAGLNRNTSEKVSEGALELVRPEYVNDRV